MKIVLYFVILFGMLSCNQNKYKYRVVGQVRVYNLGVCETHKAVWYVNKLSLDVDTLFYLNSNGRQTRIYPPFKIDTLR
jgi:hypothetical protein